MNLTDAARLNVQLVDLYLDRWADLSAAVRDQELVSNPLVIGITDGYLKASRRVAIVGQETHGWIGQFNQTPNRELVEFLQREYFGFAMGTHYRSTPFWRFVHRLLALISPGVPLTDIAWCNLNPVDIAERRPWEIEERLRPLGIVRSELAILEPDVVVFLTGPNYDYLVDRHFSGIRRESVSGYRVRELCELGHENLPKCSYRIYHPAYLQRSQTFEGTLAIIASLIEAGTQSDAFVD